MPLKLEIVTPEALIFSDEVDTVVLPGYEGEMGVLPAHAPLVTTLLGAVLLGQVPDGKAAVGMVVLLLSAVLLPYLGSGGSTRA